jgi:hypothetical protein
VTFEGSAGATHLEAPIVGIAENPAGLGDSPNADGNEGSWLAASDGGVFTYGGAQFFGSLSARVRVITGP